MPSCSTFQMERILHLGQLLTHPVWPDAGQFAAYVNIVTEAFDLETVCKCRASRDYSQKGIPSPGIFSRPLQACFSYSSLGD